MQNYTSEKFIDLIVYVWFLHYSDTWIVVVLVWDACIQGIYHDARFHFVGAGGLITFRYDTDGLQLTKTLEINVRQWGNGVQYVMRRYLNCSMTVEGTTTCDVINTKKTVSGMILVWKWSYYNE